MKKLLFVVLMLLSAAPAHAERSFQVGADLVVPYQMNSPKGRLTLLGGGHGEVFLNDATSITLSALFGLEDTAPADRPFYLTPGISFYLPFPILNPYIHADLPILLNNGKDIGVQAGAGVLWNIILGLGIKYSIDVAYYFDSEAKVVNWANIGAVFTF